MNEHDPEWASYNIGIFLCTRCCAVHRSMGAHISKVKHLKLDKWEDSQLERMIEVGNKASKLKYEQRVPACYRRPRENDPHGQLPVDVNKLCPFQQLSPDEPDVSGILSTAPTQVSHNGDHPEWASYNIGIFLCTRCCAVHRSMGAHISKVKHLKLDKWEDSQLERMIEVGNKASKLKSGFGHRGRQELLQPKKVLFEAPTLRTCISETIAPSWLLPVAFDR
ncbi:centaurin-alpha 2 [Culex quinquefasciatus]|uniref:Centaurin-alpha 2 n=1 Tax=Culex quinquefasciatus TaxID=7176 RepID=B0XIK7_CULQU|nr:centaurin-alpha 2 [Culex quinquefasciatus]|eukprot:XP_001869479.1 centaurin-alpha 2 [Culex quinquefasciatus]